MVGSNYTIADVRSWCQEW